MVSFAFGCALIVSIPVIVSIVFILSAYGVEQKAETTAKSTIGQYRQINCTVLGLVGKPVPGRGSLVVEYSYINSRSAGITPATMHRDEATLTFNSGFTVEQFYAFVERCCTVNSTHVCFDGSAFGDSVYFEKAPPYKEAQAYLSKTTLITVLYAIGIGLLSVTALFSVLISVAVMAVNSH